MNQLDGLPPALALLPAGWLGWRMSVPALDGAVRIEPAHGAVLRCAPQLAALPVSGAFPVGARPRWSAHWPCWPPPTRCKCSRAWMGGGRPWCR
ncbi:hypothetical protein [Massilia aquatica]|uniref:hypothetical protein n=1 Tax=Massilia aquatica TaxID=2609000 RepID=UPI001E2BE258|nr:hypothetical protein [Massilia aquatica]